MFGSCCGVLEIVVASVGGKCDVCWRWLQCLLEVVVMCVGGDHVVFKAVMLGVEDGYDLLYVVVCIGGYYFVLEVTLDF
jgi:hypothetical protein